MRYNDDYDREFQELNSSISPLSNQQRMSDPALFQGISNYGQNLVNKATKQTKNILSKFVPHSQKQIVEQVETEIIQDELKFRHQALYKVRETQMRRLEQACYQYLQMEKADSLTQTQAYIVQKFHDLQRKLDNMFDDFIESVEEKAAKLELIQHPKLKQAKKEQIDRDIRAFKDMQEQAIDRFLKAFRQYL